MEPNITKTETSVGLIETLIHTNFYHVGGLWQSAQIMEDLFVVVRKSMQIAPISCHDLTFVFVWSKYMQG